MSCGSLTTIMIPADVEIHYETFDGCSSLETVYYGGTEQEWEELYANLDCSVNENFVDATHYYYSQSQPTEEGNYWRYVDGVPTVW